jgi:15-cis-phytoene synthase
MSHELASVRSDMLACRAVLEANSKSFALAARLLPSASRDEAACVYAFCRRVDDAIDNAPPSEHQRALAKLVAELDAVYDGEAQADPSLRGFQAVVRARNLPKRYPLELLAGMAMDARGTRYTSLQDLLLYCHRVAGVVGLMMCHAFGLTDDGALVPAAHLGIAMQLTNICRDVAEDYSLGRVYLPAELLAAHGAPELAPREGERFPDDPRVVRATQQVMGLLLDEADRYYRSAQTGVVALPYRAGLAVRAASKLYSAIGDEVRARGCDPRRGRAVVPRPRKLTLVLGAIAEQLGASFAYARAHTRGALHAPQRELAFPEDVLA